MEVAVQLYSFGCQSAAPQFAISVKMLLLPRESRRAVHLFLEGHVAQQVWEHFHNVFGMQLTSSIHGVALRIMTWYLSAPSDNHIRWIISTVVLWFLWKARNAAKFQSNTFHRRAIIFEIYKFLNMLGASKAIHYHYMAGDM